MSKTWLTGSDIRGAVRMAQDAGPLDLGNVSRNLHQIVADRARLVGVVRSLLEAHCKRTGEYCGCRRDAGDAHREARACLRAQNR